LTAQTEEISMAANQLKRAECAIEAIREQAELPPEAITALQEIFDVVRNIENRLSLLEGKGRIHPTAEMGLPNRR
jgi:uncharacterized membrane protein YccC